MIESPWVSIAIVWIVTLVMASVLWQRFTRVPIQPSRFASRLPGSKLPAMTRRVVPLWLAVILLILLSTAVWLTVRWVP